ncbi:hypothetical protein CCACVL1_20310 [Corchorus capsularis]|uniref:Uncharacterized protein n=1 Tax=Corchorus capsularis TaxID=210143 RepID=A0A1R3HC33_COCAP|nr:hypothetical protein CCACVL1_20310 [Corchorus capsularis]
MDSAKGVSGGDEVVGPGGVSSGKRLSEKESEGLRWRQRLG